MAYNHKNRLHRIVDIQTLYLEYQARGVSGEYIYKRMIAPHYRISRRTFYQYLAVNAKRQLAEGGSNIKRGWQ